MPLPLPSEPSLANTEFGRYHLLDQIGEGANGVVYRAHDAERGRDVAVKMLRLHLTGDASALRRFELEYQTLAKLEHPNVPRIHGPIERLPRPHFAMDFIDGPTLARRIAERSPLPLQEVLTYAKALASALAAMHARGLVHRDLKPGNIRLQKSEDAPFLIVKLLDFGIVRQVDAPRTETGGAIGTPEYMAPERDAGPEGDVFAFGLVLAEMSGGKRYITGKTPSQRSAERAQLSRKIEQAPQEIQPLLRKVLRLDKTKRPTSSQVMVEVQLIIDRQSGVPSLPATISESGALNGELGQALTPPPQRRARRRAATLVALAVSVTLSALVAQQQLHRRQTWSRISEAGALHDKAQARLPPLIDVGGATTRLGSPLALIERIRKGLAAWPPALLGPILLRQEQHEATIHSFALFEYEVSWQNVADWLNELLLRNRIEVRREQKAPALLRYVYDDRGRFLFDVDASVSGLIFDDRARVFNVREGYKNLPAELGTWDAADSFCRAYGLRLPTSDEWELAGRGTTGRLVPDGKDEHDPPLQCREAVISRDPLYSDSQCRDLPFAPEDVRGTRVTGRDQPRDETPEHIMNMAGNVSEWVADRCQNLAEPEQLETDYRAFRGGDYTSEIERGYLTFVSCNPRFAAPDSGTSVHRGLGWRCAK